MHRWIQTSTRRNDFKGTVSLPSRGGPRPSAPMQFSTRFAKQVSFVTCLVFAFTVLDKGTAAFSLPPAPFGLTDTPLYTSRGFSCRIAPNTACVRTSALRPSQPLRPTALGIQMQGESWLDRAIAKLVGGGGYAPMLETTEDANSRGYYVILEDDDQHTVDQVVKIVRKVILARCVSTFV